MTRTWERKRLGDLCQLLSGQHIEAKDYNTDGRGIGYLTGPSDFGELYPVVSKWTEHPKVKAESGDILITVKGSGVGKVNLLNQDQIAISRQLMALRVKGADPQFIYAFISSKFDHFQSLATGAAIPGISREQVLGLELTLPPLPEQKRIVSILDETFEGIATAKANAEQNLRNASALFRSQLDLIFKHKGIGWVDRPLESVCRFINGRAYKKEELLSDGKYPVLRVGNFFTNNHWYYSDLELDDDKYCDHGDLLYAWSASFGPRIWSRSKVIYHYHIWKIIPECRMITKEYLFYLLEWDVDQIKKAHGTGTTMMHVGKGSIEKRLAPIAPMEEQFKIADSLRISYEESQRLESIYRQKITALNELKKALLHKAFAGEL